MRPIIANNIVILHMIIKRVRIIGESGIIDGILRHVLIFASWIVIDLLSMVD